MEARGRTDDTYEVAGVTVTLKYELQSAIGSWVGKMVLWRAARESHG